MNTALMLSTSDISIGTAIRPAGYGRVETGSQR